MKLVMAARAAWWRWPAPRDRSLSEVVRFEASVETRMFRSSQGVVTGETPGRWEARAQVRGVGRRGRRERLA